MKVLDLFSGIGGFSLGLERAGMETVAFCEIEPYCQKVLKKHWPDVPIYEDIRELGGEQFGGTIDLVCGGYPCQPFSHAGKRRGAEDDRHLWPEYYRLIQEIRPRWVIGENVAGHINMGLDEVLSDLERSGYAWEAFVIPACAVDAPHRRDRIWIIGNSNSNSNSKPACALNDEAQGLCAMGNAGCERNESNGKRGKRNGAASSMQGKARKQRVWPETSITGQNVADTISGRQPGSWQPFDTGSSTEKENRETTRSVNGGIGSIWKPEPPVGRVANGIPRRMDRLKGLGNAVVPQIPEIIGRAILEAEKRI